MATCSWDNTLCYWDMRTSQVVNSVDLKTPIYAADFVGQMAAVALNDKILCFQNGNLYKEHAKDKLVKEVRTIKIFPAQNGYAYGTVDGRVHFEDFTDSSKKATYTFKAHMKKSSSYSRSAQTSFYSTNDISFHDDSSLATGGGEGSIFYWDRMRQFKLGVLFEQKSNTPVKIGNISINNNRITTTTFHQNKNKIAFAVGYDWMDGESGYSEVFKPHVLVIHDVKGYMDKDKKK